MDEKNIIVTMLDGDDTIKKSQSQNTFTLSKLNQYANGSYPLDVIKKFMASLDTTSLKGEDALDEAVKACSNFDTAQDAIDQMIADLKDSDSETFLVDKCGIVLDNDDTGAITGLDAGGSTSKNAEDIVPETGTPSYPDGTSFTIRGLTVNIPAKEDLTADQQTIVQGLYSWWIDECLNLIEESYGLTFDNDASISEIDLDFDYSLGSSTLAAVSYTTSSSTGKVTNLGLHINTDNFFKNISTDNVNGSTSNAKIYLDRTLAHELTHAVLAAKIDYHNKLPIFFKEGIAELTHGVDDFRKTKITELVKSPSSLKSALSLTKTGGATTSNYAGGYIFLRYLAKQGAEMLNDTTVDEDVVEVTKSATISGSNDYTISGSGTYVISSGYHGTITINTPYSVTLDGTDAGSLTNVYVKVSSNTASANVTINNLRVTNTSDSVIDFGGTSGSNQLTISGTTNSLSNNNNYATVNIGSGLIVNGTGSLTVSAGGKAAAIGTDYAESDTTATLTIGGGTITATSADGAALGSDYSGWYNYCYGVK